MGKLRLQWTQIKFFRGADWHLRLKKCFTSPATATITKRQWSFDGSNKLVSLKKNLADVFKRRLWRRLPNFLKEITFLEPSKTPPLPFRSVVAVAWLKKHTIFRFRYPSATPKVLICVHRRCNFPIQHSFYPCLPCSAIWDVKDKHFLSKISSVRICMGNNSWEMDWSGKDKSQVVYDLL